MNNLVHKNICLLEEVLTSIRLLKEGMGTLQEVGGGNDFYHAPILLLSSGYERLIKCILCLTSMDDNGIVKETPFEITVSKGHDLIYLLNKLLSVCDEKGYSSKFPAAKVDVEFLKDEDLRKMVSRLSDFAQGGRYHNLDTVMKGTSSHTNPVTGWQKIEMTIFQSRKGLLEKLGENNSDISKEVNREFIILLEKFARALARLFTLADFGDLAKQASPLVYDYLMLKDKDLGTRDYRNTGVSRK